ncbi:MAG: 2OG-Fe(II) oxygenase [SAR324 cluster bacterium]|nr:2OG-Fe(II) oxygenase [SAR324 cluster bacterium]
MKLETLVNLKQHPIQDSGYTQKCKALLDSTGALVLENFLSSETIEILQNEAQEVRPLAFFCHQNHNAYLLDSDATFPVEHIRNYELVSDKGCIPHDQVPDDSLLRVLYEWPNFRKFLKQVLGESIFPYADALSSININYYEQGQQLGWHYDNASFAVTLMIEAPEEGGEFEYLEKVRNKEAGEQGYADTEAVIKGSLQPKTLAMGDGALVLFRGRNSLHRVAPVISDRARILVTLNFNTEPGVMLSELVRMTFFGRIV